jgi:hypothetical protein
MRYDAVRCDDAMRYYDVMQHEARGGAGRGIPCDVNLLIREIKRCRYCDTKDQIRYVCCVSRGSNIDHKPKTHLLARNHIALFSRIAYGALRRGFLVPLCAGGIDQESQHEQAQLKHHFLTVCCLKAQLFQLQAEIQT